MKHVDTMKNIKQEYTNIIEVPYCGLQHLLRFADADAYTSGIYGWNADVYDIGYGIAICTGYRPFGTIKANRETVRQFDAKAQEILTANSYSNYVNIAEKLRQLTIEFVNVVFHDELCK